MKLSNFFYIDRKIISQTGPTYIVAEIGINHSGSKSKCEKLIKMAHKSGADAVKLQLADPNLSYSKNHPTFKEFKNKFLSDESLSNLIKYSKSLGISLFATPGDFSSLERIVKLKMPAIKISSGLLNNLPLIKEASKKNVPIILSTGMAYLNEISDAVKICSKNQKKIALLKCTSIYPAPIQNLNLNGINELRKKFKVPVGYSDHANGIEASIYSVAFGARIIEKHFTLNRFEKGADHKISIEPKQFATMVKKVRDLESMMGEKILKPTKQEIKNRKFSYRKLVTSKKIYAGEKITLKNITFKRTLAKKNGIKPKHFFKVLGKRVSKNLKDEKILSFSDFL